MFEGADTTSRASGAARALNRPGDVGVEGTHVGVGQGRGSKPCEVGAIGGRSAYFLAVTNRGHIHKSRHHIVEPHGVLSEARCGVNGGHVRAVLSLTGGVFLSRGHGQEAVGGQDEEEEEEEEHPLTSVSAAVLLCCCWESCALDLL